MMKWLKIIASVLGIVILVGIIALILLVTFVSPNRFKPLIIDQVKKYTGRDLAIDGDLSWTVFPTLGVKVGHLQLSNPAEFKQKVFAEVQNATVSVKILPLLHSKIKSDGITLNGLKLYLIKNANGDTNWQDLQQSSTSVKAAPSSHDAQTTPRSPLGLFVSGIDISDATISWIDEKAKQTIDIQKFEFHATDISVTKPFPLQASFDFTGKNPSMTGRVSLKSKVSLNLEKQMYVLDNVTLTTKVNKDTKKFDVTLQGNIVADLARQKVQLDNLTAEMGNLKAIGKINVTDLSTTPKVTGHLQVQPFDVKTWLQSMGQHVASVQTLKNMSGDFDFTAGTSLQSVDLQGKVKVDEVQASKVRVTNINVTTNLQKGILALAPFSADFYQGNVQGQAKVNLNSATPQISLDAKGANIQAEPLLTDVAASQKFKLSGACNLDAKLTTTGTDAETIEKNLNGTTHLSFNNGVLHGIDIGYLIDSAYAMAGKQSAPSNNTDQTPFGSLTASADIHNGVVTNNDLNIDAPRFNTKGSGVINLITQKINYRLETTAKQADASQKDNLGNLYGIAIPIEITGTMNNPSIRLDSGALMKAVAQQQVKKAKSQIQEKIEKQIQGKLPGDAGALINNLLGH